ncbi:hypothetical protein ECANGB1_1229 [Enterospora canceri]|uniref:Uncharacterized protein n=1 Tax=Enterospora canceri TaxID=1081671 RepID=A0A1Y1S6P6_9MICR|nr:hypothetical protein ECANGB1_1229 [Enterospora canceri]
MKPNEDQNEQPNKKGVKSEIVVKRCKFDTEANKYYVVRNNVLQEVNSKEFKAETEACNDNLVALERAYDHEKYELENGGCISSFFCCK